MSAKEKPLKKGVKPKIANDTEAVGSLRAITERLTPELVIGLVGPIASGVSTCGEYIKQKLESDYGYEGEIVKVSDIIKNDKGLVGFDDAVEDKGSVRVENLQEIGSKLRQKFGSDILAAKCVESIGTFRVATGYEDEKLMSPKPLRRVTIIDSLKNQSEVELLRLVYREAFWLVGVFADENMRRERLKAQKMSIADIDKIFKMDYHEGPDYGQDTRDTFFISDYFINNNSTKKDIIEQSVDRFLDVVFASSVPTPTKEESGMAMAKQAAVLSTCLSRQVGAVILNKEGSVIGKGWNEVPKYGGGVYGYSDESDVANFRCFECGEENCRNDSFKKDRLDEIILFGEECGLKGAEFLTFKEKVRNSKLKSLIEFSRSVHAEMAAIIDVARFRKGDLKGSTLLVTTFPCHNCARHVIVSGIKRVVFIEPYPKSLALELHGDAMQDMTASNVDVNNKVQLQPFEGVGPERFNSVFVRKGDIKDQKTKKRKETNRKRLFPADPVNLDAFSTLEKRVAGDISKRES